MKKSKYQFYVVWKGVEPGIYDSWEKCKKKIEGYPGAVYKGFSSLDEAKSAINLDPTSFFSKKSHSKIVQSNTRTTQPVKPSLCVDAACSGNPGILEYRGVYYPSGEEIFHRGPFPEGTVNIGEFLAIVTGLAWLQKQNLNIPLYSDSKNGILWVRQKRTNTKLPRNTRNEDLFQIMEKAIEWLHNNSNSNHILKWETSNWGENPADFGRK